MARFTQGMTYILRHLLTLSNTDPKTRLQAWSLRDIKMLLCDTSFWTRRLASISAKYNRLKPMVLWKNVGHSLLTPSLRWHIGTYVHCLLGCGACSPEYSSKEVNMCLFQNWITIGTIADPHPYTMFWPWKVTRVIRYQEWVPETGFICPSMTS